MWRRLLGSFPSRVLVIIMTGAKRYGRLLFGSLRLHAVRGFTGAIIFSESVYVH